MKIDIVDLMDFYENDAPVPDAQEEMLKQGGSKLVLKRETRHRRNRPLLAAVVMLLAVLVVMPFALPRITGDPAAVNTENAQSAEASNGYQTAPPVGSQPTEASNGYPVAPPIGDPAAAGTENAQSAEASDDYQAAHIAGLLLPSAVYPVALEIPAEYVEEIEVDTPFLDMSCETVQFDNAVFSFYDKSSQEYGRIGLVWCIIATPINEYTPLDPVNYDFIFEYNRAELGTDEDYAYELIYPRAARQCNIKDSENVESYFAHHAIGQDLLTQFIQQNSLQSDGVGVERYAAFIALQKKQVQ